MKHLLILTFLLIMIPMQSMADFYTTESRCNNETENGETVCQKTAGCYWNPDNKECTRCPAGTYNDGKSPSGCYTCSNLDNYSENTASAVYDNTTGATGNHCAWDISCEYGYVWDGTKCDYCGENKFTTDAQPVDFYMKEDEQTRFEADSISCMTCGSNSVVNSEGNGCNCNAGYKMEGSPAGNPITEDIKYNNRPCVEMNITDYPINEYTIHLNRPWDSYDAMAYLYVRDTDWVISPTQNPKPTHDWIEDNKIIIAPEVLPEEFFADDTDYENGTAYTIKRYIRTSYNKVPEFNKCDESEFEYFGLKPNEKPGTLEIFADDELYLCWTYKSYTVEYYTNESNTDTLVYTDTASYDNKHDAASKNNKNIPWPAGKIPTGWECIENCDSNTYAFGDEVTPKTGAPNNSIIKLRMLTKDCDAGYYCNNNEQKECPTDLTSKAGAATITECGITNTTIFTDNNDKSLQLRLGNGVILPCKWCTEQSSSI